MLGIRSIILLARQKIYFWRLGRANKGKDAKEVFSEYWRKNHWKNSESKSGDGSTLLYTEHLREELPKLLERIQASSLLDAPCGDFNWFKEINLSQSIAYMGGDIVDEMIGELNRKFGGNSRSFIVLDAVKDSLPNVDIWLCRDLIFHLPSADVLSLITNFTKSTVNYLLITSHTEHSIKNKDTFVGGFRLLNLCNPPFSLPPPDERIRDYIEGYPERYLLLYKRTTLNAWVKESAR